jgi:hypothetical protein
LPAATGYNSIMRLETAIQMWHDPDSGQYIIRATPLDVTTSAATPDEARVALAEAVRLFLESENAPAILEECGYRRIGDRWVGPEMIDTGVQSIPLGVHA